MNLLFGKLFTLLLSIILVGCSTRSAMMASYDLAGTTEQLIEVETGRVLSFDELVTALSPHRLLLFGEQHDSLPHHLRQAFLLHSLFSDSNGSVSLVLERFPRDATELVTFTLDKDFSLESLWESRANGSKNTPAAAYFEFASYFPLFSLASQKEYSLVAADINRSLIRHQMSQRYRPDSISQLTDSSNSLLSRLLKRIETVPLTSSQKEYFSEQILTSHCGHTPSAQVQEGMIEIQTLRDASLALSFEQAVANASDSRGVVGIFGNEHIRSSGVPRLLNLSGTHTMRSVAFFERSESQETEELLKDARAGDIDYLWLTPRTSSADPCERFKKALERISKHQAKTQKQRQAPPK